MCMLSEQLLCEATINCSSYRPGILFRHMEGKAEFIHQKGSKVYYAGDIAPLDKTVVYAVRKGKDVANEVLKDLEAKR